MNPYDQIAYINSPHQQTHPSRMHVIARLHGLEPPPVATCRVLELGASEGSNLIGMAVALPGADFTGIDLAEAPVARGNQTIADLGLRNVRLLRMNLLDIDAGFGEFDYIIAHGIYAWTPAEVRDKVLAIARANLHPNGVAFVSYNTYPGAGLRQSMREMLVYHLTKVEDPAERLGAARDFAKAFRGSRPDPDALDIAFAAIAAEFADSTDSSLFHDELAEIYRPVYFRDFVSHAASQQLQYVDDSGTFDAFPRNLSDEAARSAKRMGGGDWIRELQYLDFLSARTFRQSLLCHAGRAVSSSWQTERLEGCYATTLARETKDGAFELPDGNRMNTTHPEPIAYLRRLSARFPRAVRITADDTHVASLLLRMRLVEIHAFEGMASKAGERPCASPLVRHQMARGQNPVTTLWHEPLDFTEELPARLIALLDGTRDRTELAAAMQGPVEAINRKLAEFGYYAILTS